MNTLTSLSSRRPKLLLAIVAFIFGGAIFGAMWHSVTTHADFSRLDQPILTMLVAHRSAPLTNMFEAITTLLAPAVFASIVIIGCVIWAMRRRETWRPLLLMGAMALAMITSTLIKHFVARSRPPHDFMLAPFELDFSFPSGHTIGIAVFVFVLSYLLYSRRVSVGRGILWLFGGGVAIALVALSRLYLGYHWITDVTASVGLALMILAVMITIDIVPPTRFKHGAPARRVRQSS